MDARLRNEVRASWTLLGASVFFLGLGNLVWWQAAREKALLPPLAEALGRDRPRS